MGCEQVCLKWNNFAFNITKNIDDLWKDESLVDVSLISEGQCIQAHKVILSASSPLFKSLFAANPCQHPVIILQDVRFRELLSIIRFIYKGEVNIFEENLPNLLQAAKTLQIRGLSDSVDKDSLNRLYSQHSDEIQTKRRKVNTEDSPPVQQTQNELNVVDYVTPKEEPKLDNFPSDFLTCVSDEESDVKRENIHESAQDLIHTDIIQPEVLLGNIVEDHNFKLGQTFETYDELKENYQLLCARYFHPMVIRTRSDKQIIYKCCHGVQHKSKSTGIRPNQHYYYKGCQAQINVYKGIHIVGKQVYQHMPFANLLPSPEVLLRWSQSQSLDQLAIDLMKRLFSTEERLICNVNGKMGKPRFHTGKISLLREVLYHYSGLSPSEFELHWKNCVTKIDTSNRGLKRNKKMKMFFMDQFLAKSFS